MYYIVTCNLVDNNLSVPNNVLHSFTLPDVAFGGQISGINEPIFSKIKTGKYRHLTVQILDQEYNPLQILDPNMLLVLSIKEGKKEEE